MKKYRVLQCDSYELIIEADDYDSAREIASETPLSGWDSIGDNIWEFEEIYEDDE